MPPSLGLAMGLCAAVSEAPELEKEITEEIQEQILTQETQETVASEISEQKLKEEEIFDVTREEGITRETQDEIATQIQEQTFKQDEIFEEAQGETFTQESQEEFSTEVQTLKEEEVLEQVQEETITIETKEENATETQEQTTKEEEIFEESLEEAKPQEEVATEVCDDIYEKEQIQQTVESFDTEIREQTQKEDEAEEEIFKHDTVSADVPEATQEEEFIEAQEFVGQEAESTEILIQTYEGEENQEDRMTRESQETVSTAVHVHTTEERVETIETEHVSETYLQKDYDEDLVERDIVSQEKIVITETEKIFDEDYEKVPETEEDRAESPTAEDDAAVEIPIEKDETTDQAKDDIPKDQETGPTEQILFTETSKDVYTEDQTEIYTDVRDQIFTEEVYQEERQIKVEHEEIFDKEDLPVQTDQEPQTVHEETIDRDEKEIVETQPEFATFTEEDREETLEMEEEKEYVVEEMQQDLKQDVVDTKEERDETEESESIEEEKVEETFEEKEFEETTDLTDVATEEIGIEELSEKREIQESTGQSELVEDEFEETEEKQSTDTIQEVEVVEKPIKTEFEETTEQREVEIVEQDTITFEPAKDDYHEEDRIYVKDEPRVGEIDHTDDEKIVVTEMIESVESEQDERGVEVEQEDTEEVVEQREQIDQIGEVESVPVVSHLQEEREVSEQSEEQYEEETREETLDDDQEEIKGDELDSDKEIVDKLEYTSKEDMIESDKEGTSEIGEDSEQRKVESPTLEQFEETKEETVQSLEDDSEQKLESSEDFEQKEQYLEETEEVQHEQKIITSRITEEYYEERDTVKSSEHFEETGEELNEEGGASEIIEESEKVEIVKQAQEETQEYYDQVTESPELIDKTEQKEITVEDQYEQTETEHKESEEELVEKEHFESEYREETFTESYETVQEAEKNIQEEETEQSHVQVSVDGLVDVSESMHIDQDVAPEQEEDDLEIRKTVACREVKTDFDETFQRLDEQYGGDIRYETVTTTEETFQEDLPVSAPGAAKVDEVETVEEQEELESKMLEIEVEERTEVIEDVIERSQKESVSFGMVEDTLRQLAEKDKNIEGVEGDVLEEREESESEVESVEAPEKTQEMVFVEKVSEDLEVLEDESVEQTEIPAEISIEPTESDLAVCDSVEEIHPSDVIVDRTEDIGSISADKAGDDEELIEPEKEISEQVAEEKIELSFVDSVATGRVVDDDEPTEAREIVQEDMRTQAVETVSSERTFDYHDSTLVREVSCEEVVESHITDTVETVEHVEEIVPERQLSLVDSRQGEEVQSDMEQVETVSVKSDDESDMQDVVIQSAQEQHIAETVFETRSESSEEEFVESKLDDKETEQDYVETAIQEKVEEITFTEQTTESHISHQEHITAIYEKSFEGTTMTEDEFREEQEFIDHKDIPFDETGVDNRVEETAVATLESEGASVPETKEESLVGDEEISVDTQEDQTVLDTLQKSYESETGEKVRAAAALAEAIDMVMEDEEVQRDIPQTDQQATAADRFEKDDFETESELPIEHQIEVDQQDVMQENAEVAAASVLEDEGYDELMEEKTEEQPIVAPEEEEDFIERDHPVDDRVPQGEEPELEHYREAEGDETHAESEEPVRDEELYDTEAQESFRKEPAETYETTKESYTETYESHEEQTFQAKEETHLRETTYSESRELQREEILEEKTKETSTFVSESFVEKDSLEELQAGQHSPDLESKDSDDEAWEMLEKDELSQEELEAADNEMLMQVSIEELKETKEDIPSQQPEFAFIPSEEAGEVVTESQDIVTESQEVASKLDISDEELVEKEPFSPFDTKKTSDHFDTPLVGTNEDVIDTKEVDQTDRMKESESSLDMAEVEIVSVEDNASYQNRIDQVIVDQASFEMEGEPVEVAFRSGSSELSDEDLKERKLSASEFAQSQTVSEQDEAQDTPEKDYGEEPEQIVEIQETDDHTEDIDVQADDVDEEFAETEEPELEKLAETEDADEYSDVSPSFEGPIEQGYVESDSPEIDQEVKREISPDHSSPLTQEQGTEGIRIEIDESERPHRPEPGTDTSYIVTATPEQVEKTTPSELDIEVEEEPKSEKEYQQIEEKDVESPIIGEKEEDNFIEEHFEEAYSEQQIQETEEHFEEKHTDLVSSDEKSDEVKEEKLESKSEKEDSDEFAKEMLKEDLIDKTTRIEFSETHTETVHRVEIQSTKQTDVLEEFDSFKHRDEITQKEEKSNLMQSFTMTESYESSATAKYDSVQSPSEEDFVTDTSEVKTEMEMKESTLVKSDLDIDTTEMVLVKSDLDLDTTETRPEPEELDLEDKDEGHPVCAEAELITSSLEATEDHDRAESIETASVDSQKLIEQTEEYVAAAEASVGAVPWTTEEIKVEESDELSSDEDDLGASREPTSDSDTIPDDAKFDDEDVSPSKLEEAVTYEEPADKPESTPVAKEIKSDETTFESFSFTQHETVIEHTTSYYSDEDAKEYEIKTTEDIVEPHDLEDLHRPEEKEIKDISHQSSQEEDEIVPQIKSFESAGVRSIESSMTASIYEPADFDDVQEPEATETENYIDRQEEFIEEERPTETAECQVIQDKIEEKESESIVDESFVDRREYFLEEITEVLTNESSKQEGDASVDASGGDGFFIDGLAPTSGPSTDQASSSYHPPPKGDMTDFSSNQQDSIHLALHAPLLPTSSTEVHDRSGTPSDIEPDELDAVPEKKVVHSDSNERAQSPLDFSYQARHPFEESDITGASADDEMEPEGRITADTSQQIFIEQSIESRKPPKVGGYSSGDDDEDRPPSPSEFTLVQSHDQDMLMKALGIDQTIDEDRSSEEETESESASESEAEEGEDVEDRPPSPTEFTLVASQDQDTLTRALVDESDPDYALQEEHLIYIQDADMPPKIGFGDDMLRDPLSDGFTTGTSSAEAPDASEQSSSEQAQKETLDQSVENNTISTLSSELNEQTALEPTAPPLSPFEESSEQTTVMISSYEKLYQGIKVETTSHSEQILDIGDHFDTKQPDLHYQPAGRSSSFEDLYQQEESAAEAAEEVPENTEQEEKLSSPTADLARFDDVHDQAARGMEEEEEYPEMMEDESMSSLNSSLTGTGEESTRLLLKKEVHTKTTIGPDGREQTMIKEDLQVRQDNDPPEELRDSMQDIIDQFMEANSGRIPELEKKMELEDDV